MRLSTIPNPLSLRGSARKHQEFYRSPSSIDGEPGGLLRAEPVRVKLLPGVQLRVRAWRVLYRSSSANRAPIAVSGIVLVPHGTYQGPRPLIGYAIGTQGHAQRCAPSLQLVAGLEYETPLITRILRRGWAVALTDYPGLGTGGGHPYIVGRALGPAVLDSMRAARNLADTGLAEDGPAALFGYSEGGTAAAWAAQLQPTYAPDILLVAAAVGGVCADLEYSADFLTGGRFAWLQAYAAAGLDIAYPELRLARYLNDHGHRMYPRLIDTHIVGQIIARMPYRFDRARYVVTDPLTDPDWLARMRENRLGALAPAAPVLLTHGSADQAVGYEQAIQLHDDWSRLGVDVTFRGYRGLEHLTAAVAHTRTALPWLSAHIADHRANDTGTPPITGFETA
ncbi:lipase family protein [Nocardia sp. NPDC004278]